MDLYTVHWPHLPHVRAQIIYALSKSNLPNHFSHSTKQTPHPSTHCVWKQCAVVCHHIYRITTLYTTRRYCVFSQRRIVSWWLRGLYEFSPVYPVVVVSTHYTLQQKSGGEHTMCWCLWVSIDFGIHIHLKCTTHLGLLEIQNRYWELLERFHINSGSRDF